jgi:hypothetical protein
LPGAWRQIIGNQLTPDTGSLLETSSSNSAKSPESHIELVVEDPDGKDVAKAAQKPAPEGADDDVTLRLSYLCALFKTSY